jgi:hypothetical protein
MTVRTRKEWREGHFALKVSKYPLVDIVRVKRG